jgi:ABC-type lipoprotein export system ATPase subunit
MIRLLGVTKQFGGGKSAVCEVFSNADFNIAGSCSVAIKGRSGSGKSTLLSILAGLDLKYAGDYYFKEMKLQKDRGKMAVYRMRHIGIVTQNYRLLSDRHCYDNVAFPLRCLKLDEKTIREKVYETMTLLDVLMFKDKYPHELSGGQCQRVAIARAVVKSPDILLADEPTGALDEVSEYEVLKMLDLLLSKGQTLVVATHSDLVAQHCASTYEIRDYEIKRIK